MERIGPVDRAAQGRRGEEAGGWVGKAPKTFDLAGYSCGLGCEVPLRRQYASGPEF